MTPEEIHAALRLSESLVRQRLERVKYGYVLVKWIIQDGKVVGVDTDEGERLRVQ